VLVVEDDPRVLAQTVEALAELGHLPIACNHPADATRMLDDNAGVGLIINDVLIPETTGPEMVRQLPDRFRAIPVLFVTGYAGDIAENSLFHDHPVLRKPYTLGALSAAIGHAINRAVTESHRSETAAAAE
jgi:CheY-like chemotaxis protein